MLAVTYSEVGATAGELPGGYHHLRRERVVGHGSEEFARAADDLLTGAVQRRAGATVWLSEVPLREGTHVRMRLRVGPLLFNIPCVVVWTERTATSCGFAYGTLPGHPERGEERFEVQLTPAGDVIFRIVAFSAPGRWFTRLGGPVARLVQRTTTDRYLRALDQATAG
ncbi:DUF1990 domain-containing protein [Microbacterium sp. 4R-513]|uniref:DUF1990 family protein n=1 Tax=Microbacterium sp. 4R-513 TaxID=2567934 RepID=UPI0013E1F904|nr:DUF1990 domain-containing protein [Microbacterium sp. 4R-513]QIG40411.1 DUF1990 domain-containing protein [Microbacterium sp. 4R-513]